ncbi:hypothetical protein Bca52824_095026 [Brassica carinata]|uniref:Uncharacterized protein n=1 Tax=Brassica carinata TaxID=52824 RepID=A0A8X7P398_BRACI|nr:hypothetical protein Bca52824_095026 [Brassica carinata]
MASYQNRPGAQATDEYGNPIQQLDEYGNPIGRGATGGGGYGTGGGYGGGATGGTYGTGGEGYGAGTGALGAGVGGRHHGQEQLHKESGGGGLGGMLHRSGSGSSSSSVAHTNKTTGQIQDSVIRGVVDLVEAEIVSQSQPLSDDGDSTGASTNLSLLQINEMVEKIRIFFFAALMPIP